MLASLQDSQAKNAQFLEWFKIRGGTLHEAVGIADFEGTGRGAIALEDIAEGTVLFTIPRSVLLSTRTSALPSLLSKEDWTLLGKGWTGLILCMMYEEAQGDASPWCGYLRDLPTNFDTLIYWSEEELAMLEASSILNKVGRREADASYHTQVLPLVKRRNDVFLPEQFEAFYTLDRFHVNGSRILSRSFYVEPFAEAEDEEDEESASMEIDPEAVAKASEMSERFVTWHYKNRGRWEKSKR